jgi:hypothetical protein
MKGFVVAEEGHVVSILSPKNGTGGVTCQPFALKNYQHATIIIQLGAQAAQAGLLQVNACTDVSGDNAVAIPFNIYTQETAGNTNDVLSTRTAVPSTGYQVTANHDTFYVIEIDAAELDIESNPSGAGGEGYAYLQVVLANGSNADYFSAVAVLSGARYAERQSPTVVA